MAVIKIPRGWEIPEREATPEGSRRSRRRFLRDAGLLAVSAAIGCAPPGGEGGGPDRPATQPAGGSAAPPRSYLEGIPEDVLARYPAERSAIVDLDRALTDEAVAARYNNFYEFSENKARVAALSPALTLRPWTVRIEGLVGRERTVDVDTIVRAMGLEERLYRHRCVEAWAMTVPWTGFPLRRFIEWCEPLSPARYIRFLSFHRPWEAPGQQAAKYPWPYFEALSLAEATSELAMMATGIYGHPLPTQHGAPLRLVVPWKYGFKSIKSVERIEFTAERPETFWNSLVPHEYGFTANVDPRTPHPRWSQAYEKLIDTGEEVPTRIFNGYGEFVADLYRS
jgi:sulfoxide reductase catalytic subunit YedY